MPIQQRVSFAAAPESLLALGAEGKLREPPSSILTLSNEELCREYDYLVVCGGAFPVAHPMPFEEEDRNLDSVSPLFRLHDPLQLPPCLHAAAKPSEAVLSKHLQDTVVQISDQLAARQGGPRGGLLGPTSDVALTPHHMRATLLRFCLDKASPRLRSSTSAAAAAPPATGNGPSPLRHTTTRIAPPSARSAGKKVPSVSATRQKSGTAKSKTPRGSLSTGSSTGSIRNGKTADSRPSPMPSSAGSSRIMVPLPSKSSATSGRHSSAADLLDLVLGEVSDCSEGLPPSVRQAVKDVVASYQAQLSGGAPSPASGAGLLDAAVGLCHAGSDAAEHALAYLILTVARAAGVDVPVGSSEEPAPEGGEVPPCPTAAWWRGALLPMLHLVPQTKWQPSNLARLGNLLLAIDASLQALPDLVQPQDGEEEDTAACEVSYQNVYHASVMGVAVEDPPAEGQQEHSPGSLLVLALDGLREMEMYEETLQHLGEAGELFFRARLHGEDEEVEEDEEEDVEEELGDDSATPSRQDSGPEEMEFVHHRRRRRHRVPPPPLTAVGHLALRLSQPAEVAVQVKQVEEGLPMRVLLCPPPEAYGTQQALPSLDTPGSIRLPNAAGVIVAVGALPVPQEENKTVLSADVTVSSTRRLPSGWVEEVREAIVAASLSVAAGVRLEVERLKDAMSPYRDALVGEVLGAASDTNEEVEAARRSAEVGCGTLTQHLAALSDTDLRRCVPCRTVQLPRVRGVLMTLAHFLGHHFSDTDGPKAWQSQRWRDILRRVSVAVPELPSSTGSPTATPFSKWRDESSPRTDPSAGSTSTRDDMDLNSSGSGMETDTPVDVAALLVQRVDPVGLVGVPTPDLVAATMKLFSRPTLSVVALARALTNRQTLVQYTRTFLHLVRTACRNSAAVAAALGTIETTAALSLAVAVKLLSEFLSSQHNFPSTSGKVSDLSSLAAYKGCNPRTVASLRTCLHDLLSELFDHLSLCLERAQASVDATGFCFDAWPYGAFAMLTISLLSSATSEEDADVRFHLGRIAKRLLPQAPDDVHATVSPPAVSEEVEEEKEPKSCATGLQADLLRCALQANLTVELRREVEDSSPVTLRGAKLYRRNEYVGSCSRVAFSDTPLLVPDEPNLRLPHRIEVSKVLDWSLVRAGLCTAAPSSRRHPPLSRYSQWSAEGAQYLLGGALYGPAAGDTPAAPFLQLPPLSSSDTVSIAFSVKRLRWLVHWFVNEVEVAVLPAPPKSALWFVIDYAHTPNNARERRRPAFRCTIRAAGESPAWSPSGSSFVTRSVQHRLPAPRSKMVPGTITLHRVQSFFTLMLDHIVRLTSKSQRALQRGSFSPPTQFGPSGGPKQDENTLFGFLLSSVPLQCMEETRSWLEADRQRHLQGPQEESGAVEKHRSLPLYATSPRVYLCNLCLADYAVLLAMTLERTSSISKEILDTLTAILEVREVLMIEVQNTILSVLHVVVRMRIGGFSFSSFNPQKLWEIGLDLAQPHCLYRPVFSESSVTAPLQLSPDGIRVEATRRASSILYAFASEGILLNGATRSDGTAIVSFSVRLIFPLEDGGMTTHEVGVCVRPSQLSGRTIVLSRGSSGAAAALPSNGAWDWLFRSNRAPDSSDDRFALYTHLDGSGDPVDIPELMVHQRSWFSALRRIIFTSGDTITVRIHTLHRTVSFLRNGEPLGTLYSIPLGCDVVFPYVGLGSPNSKAQWMFSPNEVELHARYVLRAALQSWTSQLLPELKRLLQNASRGDPMGLILLGADGDERNFYYRAPQQQQSESGSAIEEIRSVNVRIHRFDGPFVMVERTDKGGDHSKVFPPQLVSTFSSVVQPVVPWPMVLPDLLAALDERMSLPQEEEDAPEGGSDGVRLREPAVLLRLLRLWTSASPSVVMASGVNATQLQNLLQRALWFVKHATSMSATSDNLVQAAWTHLVQCRDVPGQIELSCCTPATETLLAAADASATDEVSTPSSSNLSPPPASAMSFPSLMCLRCQKDWVQCTDATHGPALTHCTVLDAILTQHEIESPYTGLIGHWESGKVFIDIQETHRPLGNLEETPRTYIEAHGESVHGIFHITGQRESPVSFSGCIQFESHIQQEKDEAEVTLLSEEWSCEVCTFTNPPMTTRCEMCDTIRPGSVWTCAMCQSSFNPISETLCSVCGNPRTDRRRTRARGRGEMSFCTVCHDSSTDSNFQSLKLWRRCTKCGHDTKWIPKSKYKGSVRCQLTGDGDVLDLTYIVDGTFFCCTQLRNPTYSSESLQNLVDAAAKDAPDPHCRARYDPDNYVRPLYARPLPPPTSASPPPESVEKDVRNNKNGPGKQRGAFTAIVSAVTFYANWLVMQYAPVLTPEVFADPSVVRHLRVFERSWLSSLSQLSHAQATGMLSICFQRLSTRQLPSFHIRNITAMASEIMSIHPDLQYLRNYMLYDLVRFTHSQLKGATIKCIAELLDSIRPPFNLRSLMGVLMVQPTKRECRRAAIFAETNGVECYGTPDAFVRATSLFLQVLQRMENREPLLRFLESNVTRCFPHPVVLTHTFVGEMGELLSGQLRGSLPVRPSAGGKHYFEAVIPMGGIKGNAVVGWGTLQHENDRQFVGTDMNSWGYNFQDRILLMQAEQVIAVERLPTGGDVVGVLLDLDTLMMAWSINGEVLTWVAVPSSDGEDVYPYLCGTAQRGIAMRLSHTQYLPEGFQDFTPSPALQRGFKECSTAEPQSYSLYKELAGFIEEACVSDLHVSSSTRSLLNSRRVLRLLPRYPLVMDLVDRHNQPLVDHEEAANGQTRRVAPTAPTEVIRATAGKRNHVLEESCDSLFCCSPDEENQTGCQRSWDVTVLTPYIEHLSAMSDLTVIVTRNFDFMRDSPVFMRYYILGRDLLLSRGRWSLFEITSGTKPLLASKPQGVKIDLVTAKKALKGRYTRAGGDVAQGATGPGVLASRLSGLSAEQQALTYSVTGQLFQQIENSPIYKCAVMFFVQLQGDVTADAGGVTRSIMSAISDELNFRVVNGERTDPAVPLFKLCSHSTIFTIVPNIQRFRCEVDGAEGSYLFHRMLTWLGKLLGNVTLCGTMKLPLHFPRLVWKYLTFEESTMEDYYYDIDDSIRNTVENPELLQQSGLMERLQGPSTDTHSETTAGLRHGDSRMDMLSYSALGSMTSVTSLEDWAEAAAAAEEPLTAEQRRAKVEQALIHQYDPALFSIRNGLLSVLPESSLETIRWDDLRTRICGTPSLCADDVLSFLDCTSIPSQLHGYLQEVLESMTDTQRAQFLLFCSGQSCLPLPEKVHVNCGDDPMRMPTAHTCLPISLQLQPYASVEETREKIFMCLSHSRHFGYV